jgi:phosphoribosyl-AMP cyclohydrolase
VNFTPDDFERIDWNKNDGLVPAIVQHEGSGRVLMLGYMDRAALRRRWRAVAWCSSAARGSACGRKAKPRAMSCS